MSTFNETSVIQYILACRDEAEEAKRPRMKLNEENYEMFQMEHDFSHKREGQSTEVLSKQRMAVEQITSFFQQAITGTGDWWRCVPKDGTDGVGLLVRPEEIFKLTNHMLKKANYYSHVGNSVQSALLGALAVSRVHGCLKPKAKYVVRAEGRGKSYKKHVVATKEKTWELKLDILRQENYYPDPTGEGRYEIYESTIDLATLKQYAKEEYSAYDKAVVSEIPVHGTGADNDQEQKKAEEQGQAVSVSSSRPRVRLTEFIGDIVDPETGDIVHENCLVTIANDMYVIRKPTPNPYWHQRSDVVAAPLLEVANAVWPIALMDAPTKHNHSLNEFFNLVLDSAMQAVHGIKQLRVNAMHDPAQAVDGFKTGDTILVNDSLPIGAKVMETVVTGEVSPQALNVMNILMQEFNASALTSDLRSGVTPFREQKATAVIEQSNTITSVFEGIAKNVEAKKIHPELELAWQTTAQNWDLIDREVFVSLFGRERGEELSQLAPQDVFVNTVNGVRFDVYGITLTLGKAADFRKYTTLLQTVGTSEILIEEFSKDNSFAKLLKQILISLDIDITKIELDQAQRANNNMAPPQEDPMSQPGAAAGGAPQGMSQVPQAGGPGGGSMSDIFSRPQFPGSPASRGQ